MNSDKLKYFIDIVEEGSFTKAAAVNFVSQTTVSQHVASLEKEYEVKLINRNKKPVELTEAGKIFYLEAKKVMVQYLKLEQQMTALKQEKTSVKISYHSIVELNSLVRVIQNISEMEHIEIELEKRAINTLADSLKQGLTDLAIGIDSEFADHPEIKTIELAEGKYAVMVGENHPLYHSDYVEIKEIYQYPLVMLSPRVIGKSYQMMIDKAENEGFIPNIVQQVEDAETEMFLIQTKDLIGFFPETYPLGVENQSLRLIPLKKSLHTYKIVLAYLGPPEAFAINKVLRYVKSEIRKSNGR
ncbi:LysR family transcriptional regulator [Vagococcus sp.]|uniref:LysR family transcriptional regulator n=1 Tax=Vagococcus sp. TaxID=1933889 RepID=UPI003F990291